ncbi:acetyl-CoA carboxylase biotin carboxyl carrier protein [Pandoraea sp. ISTKB]|uniref:acetyl-CoA carboxylase biotin carboxyl carrier protein n=1 Tax=Pandoraea sp. ISTKB TaxID=1586708 RepID=UPI0008478CB5|nr:acetyl-CoA carboxylase biotin carboxyl carrier protein [Pandoraea sp. ISTKB]ODP31647.1 acetyl-CoA carboxylase, biotin carboxyl carrier protein [Pandoraea sp. ISTKB]
MSQRLEDIRKLAEVFSKTNLAEMEMEAQGFSLKLKRGAPDAGTTGQPGVMTSALPAAAGSPEAVVASVAPVASAASAASTRRDASVKIVRSGMNGNFFRASAPGEAPFVQTGDRIDVGQKLCVIEAMKMLNEVDSDWSGTVKEILGEDGSVVIVGTPLFVIEVNSDV